MSTVLRNNDYVFTYIYIQYIKSMIMLPKDWENSILKPVEELLSMKAINLFQHMLHRLTEVSSYFCRKNILFLFF